MTNTSNGYAAKQGRQERAAARQAETDGRTPSDRLASLDARLGYTVGAVRERARLLGPPPDGRKRPSRQKRAKQKGAAA